MRESAKSRARSRRGSTSQEGRWDGDDAREEGKRRRRLCSRHIVACAVSGTYLDAQVGAGDVMSSGAAYPSAMKMKNDMIVSRGGWGGWEVVI